MSRCFFGLQPGAVCTGTVHFFGLNSARLVEKGMIRQRGADWIFISAEPQEITEETTDDEIAE